SDGSTFIFGAFNDSITLDNVAVGDQGSNNLVNLGNGINNVTVENDAFGNRIIGGNAQDTFMLRNAQVKAYGGDGDDAFILDLSNGPNIVSDLQTASSNTDIEGGHSKCRLGALLRSNFGLETDGHLGGR